MRALDIRDAKGGKLWNDTFYYTLNQIPKASRIASLIERSNNLHSSHALVASLYTSLMGLGLSAKEGEHRAFIAPQRHAQPAVKQKGWPKNAIDHFILAELEAANLQPSAEADKITLLRRVYLDLIGLPPTPTEVKAFLANKRPDAYERVVDQLLASPRYGERWGRHWLDARYADITPADAPRIMWQYRDWVIRAINDDLPFDQFVIEQLAGDMLPDATAAQRIATAYRNTQINTEGGVDREQFRIDSIFDRIATTGEVLFDSLSLRPVSRP